MDTNTDIIKTRESSSESTDCESGLITISFCELCKTKPKNMEKHIISKKHILLQKGEIKCNKCEAKFKVLSSF